MRTHGMVAKCVVASLYGSLALIVAVPTAADCPPEWSPLGNGMNGSDPRVFTVTVYIGELIAGGVFLQAGIQPSNNIARWNGLSWSALGDGVTPASDSWVAALTCYDGDLIVGGRFSEAGGQPADNIARWDGTISLTTCYINAYELCWGD